MARLASRFVIALACASALGGCESEDPQPLPELHNPVLPFGKALVFRADSVVDPVSRLDSGTVALSAAIYVDQVPQLIVGGDHVRASTAMAQATLAPDGIRPGVYSGSLLDASADKVVDMRIAYDPQASTDGRWFTAPELVVDPGTGPWVGTQATLEFPPPLLVATPAQDQQVFSLTETIPLSWEVPTGATDPDNRVRVGWAHDCSGFREDYRRGVIELPAASVAAGRYDFQLRNFLIKDVSSDPLTALLINLAFLPVVAITGEPVVSTHVPPGACRVWITLYHDHLHPLPAGFTSGEVVGSRTDTVRLVYVK